MLRAYECAYTDLRVLLPTCHSSSSMWRWAILTGKCRRTIFIWYQWKCTEGSQGSSEWFTEFRHISYYSGIGCDPHGYSFYAGTMPLIQIDLQILYTNVAASDDAQLWKSLSSLADTDCTEQQCEDTSWVRLFRFIDDIDDWGHSSSEDDSTSIKLSNMCALCMTSGKMYDLVIYNSWVPYFAAVKKLKTLKTKNKQGSEVCPCHFCKQRSTVGYFLCDFQNVLGYLPKLMLFFWEIWESFN